MQAENATRLKKLRLEKGIALEEIQKKTKIHPNILRAIEGDTVTNLNPVYLKSFLKIYCNFLGVDYRDYLGDYDKQAGPALKAKEEPVRPVSTPVAVVKEAVPQHSPRQTPSFLKSASVKIKSLQPDKKTGKIVLVIFVALFSLFVAVKAGKAIFLRHPGKPAVNSVQERSGAKPKASVAGKKNKAAGDVSSEIRLGIRAKDDCWVTLKADGRIVFQRVLTRGRFESWKAKNKMELSLGNAGAVELEVNGKLFSNLGRKGQPLKNIIISREGIDIPR